MGPSAISKIRYTLILALVLGAPLLLTPAAKGGPTPTPTATPTEAGPTATPTATPTVPGPLPGAPGPTATPIAPAPPPSAAAPALTPTATPTATPTEVGHTATPTTTPTFPDPAPGASSGTPLNVNMSQREGNQTKVAIAIDPTEPDRMFAISNDGSSGVFAIYSDDAGNQWSSSDLSGLPSACCDPSASWDEFGTLFISYLTPHPNYDLVVAKSTDGGMTFVRVPTRSIYGDRPVITTGPILNGESSVWVVYKDEGDPEYRVFVQRAHVTPDGGVGTFTECVVPNSTLCFAPDIASGPNGQVLVTCQVEGIGGQLGITLIYTSLDKDGLGDQYDFTTPSFVIDTNVYFPDYIDAQPDCGIYPEAGIVYDRVSGIKGRVYMVYTDESQLENDDTDIYVIFSDDDGSSWSHEYDPEPIDPVRVNDDGTDRSQFLPRIALDQTSGQIAVSWHDCRNDDGGTGPGNRKTYANNDTQFFAATSVDGGMSFGANVLVSEGTSDEEAANVAAGGWIDYGDYTGLAFEAGYFYPAWADNSDCAQAETFCDGVTGDGPNPDGATTFDLYTARLLPEPDQLLVLSTGIMALWGLFCLRIQNRGLVR